MKIILTILLLIVLGWSIKTWIEIDDAYNYLRVKTEWCYMQNGVMIEAHCFSKDMKLIEVPANLILVY